MKSKLWSNELKFKAILYIKPLGVSMRDFSGIPFADYGCRGDAPLRAPSHRRPFKQGGTK